MRQRFQRGYAMLLVLVFVTLMMSFLAVSQRYLASALRVAQFRVQAQRRDEGTLHAAARALELLETGLPPEDPYRCQTTIATSLGTRDYLVEFASQRDGTWSVRVQPLPEIGRYPSMPGAFPQRAP